jgi:hypothetical protein
MAQDARLDASEIKVAFLFEAQTILEGLKFATGETNLCAAPCLRPHVLTPTSMAFAIGASRVSLLR